MVVVACRFWHFELKVHCPNPVTHVVAWYDAETWLACSYHAQKAETDFAKGTVVGVFSRKELGWK